MHSAKMKGHREHHCFAASCPCFRKSSLLQEALIIEKVRLETNLTGHKHKHGCVLETLRFHKIFFFIESERMFQIRNLQ